MAIPKPTVIKMAYRSVSLARPSFFAPMFCADKAETAESIVDGTKNTTPMIFSTIPTAAASTSPLRFAIIVMTINATCIKVSCKATGTPIFKIRFKVIGDGLKSAFCSLIPAECFRITKRANTTLRVWDITVPSAAPVAPREK